MKTYVSYVIQEGDQHIHSADIVETTSPPYTYSSDPPTLAIMKWVKEKQATMNSNQKFILVNIIKL